MISAIWDTYRGQISLFIEDWDRTSGLTCAKQAHDPWPTALTTLWAAVQVGTEGQSMLEEENCDLGIKSD